MSSFCFAMVPLTPALSPRAGRGRDPWRIEDAPPDRRTHACAERGGRAAAAGGVTTRVALPNTAPPVDDVSVVEFLARRAREVRLAKVHTYAAATKGLNGRDLTEMGLLAANGALGFTDGVKAVGDALVM